MSITAQFTHWFQFFEGIPLSSMDLYKSLEDELTIRKVPDTDTSHVDFLERGLLSGKRVYLKIRRDWMTYHVCVAPFGTGFFVSSRLLVQRWTGWWLLVLLALGMPMFLLLLYIAIVNASNSAVTGLILTICLSFPTILAYLAIVVAWLFYSRITYHRQDTMLAFHEAVHRILVAAVNKVIEANGRKPLSDAESKPVMHRLLRRQN